MVAGDFAQALNSLGACRLCGGDDRPLVADQRLECLDLGSQISKRLFLTCQPVAFAVLTALRTNELGDLLLPLTQALKFFAGFVAVALFIEQKLQ